MPVEAVVEIDMALGRQHHLALAMGQEPALDDLEKLAGLRQQGFDAPPVDEQEFDFRHFR